ncbi:MAG: AMP-binding protein [Porticoccaceae bacterium]|nr:AMP-binding protein [Porticoccaceae bacterium]
MAPDDSFPPFYRWFPDGVTSAFFNALDQHVFAGRGDRVALYYETPITDVKSQLSYTELLAEVSLFAGVLRSAGVIVGDTVVIYIPMIPQAVIAMLASVLFTRQYLAVLLAMNWPRGSTMPVHARLSPPLVVQIRPAT